MRFVAPTLAILCCLATGSLLAEDRSRSDSRELRVNGVDVPVKRSIRSVLEKNTSLLKVSIVLDFSGLRQKLPAVLSTFFPTNNCAQYGGRNLVMPLTHSELRAGNDSVVLAFAGRVETWICIENPVPNSTVEWEVQSVGPVKTKVPVVRTSPGAPIRTKVDAQEFSVSYFLSTQAEGSKIKVRVNQSGPNGNANNLTNTGVDVAEQVRAVVQQLIDLELSSVLPPAYGGIELTIDDAKLTLNGERLEVAIAIHSNVPADKLQAVRNYLR
jgi:hypothetical protein